jgi:hypothetical protein
MADAVTTQVLYEAPDRLVVKFTNVSDGTGESAVNKVDVSALTPAPTEVIIERIQFSTDGMAVRVLWDATTDSVAWLVPAGQTGCVDFTKSEGRGLVNDAGSGKTGDILFTTVGHSSGDTYSIVLDLRKVGAAWS